MFLSKIKATIKTIVFIGGCTFFLNAYAAENNSVLQPSGKAAFVPANTVAFTQYVSESQKNIETILSNTMPSTDQPRYLGGYTVQQAAAMRSPFQYPTSDSERCSDTSKGAAKGFLLIHGLTDSPYLMRSIRDSLKQAYPCALIRAVLLPGHGTIVGDTLKMQRDDWKGIVRYGVNSFVADKQISELYLVGFSTGTSLAINYMKEHPVTTGQVRADKITGLILLSTAVKAKSGYAWLAPIVAWFKDWSSTYAEYDAARYESFSYNAGAQFYQLTKHMTESEYALNVPVLMAVSADDNTINAQAAREFFCQASAIKRRALIWYQSIDPDVNKQIYQNQKLRCNGIVEVNLETLAPQFKTVNLAHTALTVHPDDPHYGFNGKYHHCKSYTKVQEFNACQGNKSLNIFGEEGIDDLQQYLNAEYKHYDYLRRGTFNPDYKNLEARMLCFTNEQCATKTLLKP